MTDDDSDILQRLTLRHAAARKRVEFAKRVTEASHDSQRLAVQDLAILRGELNAFRGPRGLSLISDAGESQVNDPELTRLAAAYEAAKAERESAARAHREAGEEWLTKKQPNTNITRIFASSGERWIKGAWSQAAARRQLNDCRARNGLPPVSEVQS